MNNTPSFIVENLYNLKREYGQCADFYKRISSTVDLQSGKKNVIKFKIHIDHVIVLPNLLGRKFLYGPSYGRENRPFQYGGFEDFGSRTIIIDRNDVNGTIDIDDYCIIKSRRYEVKSVKEYYDIGYVLIVTEVKGLELSQILEENVKDKIRLFQKANGF